MTPRSYGQSSSLEMFRKASFLVDLGLKNFSQLYQRRAFGSGFSPHLGSIVKPLFSHCSSVLLFLFLPFKFLSTIVALIVCLLFIDWPRRKATDREARSGRRAAYIYRWPGRLAPTASREKKAAARRESCLSSRPPEWHEE